MVIGQRYFDDILREMVRVDKKIPRGPVPTPLGVGKGITSAVGGGVAPAMVDFLTFVANEQAKAEAAARAEAAPAYAEPAEWEDVVPFTDEGIEGLQREMIIGTKALDDPAARAAFQKRVLPGEFEEIAAAKDPYGVSGTGGGAFSLDQQRFRGGQEAEAQALLRGAYMTQAEIASTVASSVDVNEVARAAFPGGAVDAVKRRAEQELAELREVTEGSVTIGRVGGGRRVVRGLETTLKTLGPQLEQLQRDRPDLVARLKDTWGLFRKGDPEYVSVEEQMKMAGMDTGGVVGVWDPLAEPIGKPSRRDRLLIAGSSRKMEEWVEREREKRLAQVPVWAKKKYRAGAVTYDELATQAGQQKERGKVIREMYNAVGGDHGPEHIKGQPFGVGPSQEFVNTLMRPGVFEEFSKYKELKPRQEMLQQQASIAKRPLDKAILAYLPSERPAFTAIMQVQQIKDRPRNTEAILPLRQRQRLEPAWVSAVMAKMDGYPTEEALAHEKARKTPRAKKYILVDILGNLQDGPPTEDNVKLYLDLHRRDKTLFGEGAPNTFAGATERWGSVSARASLLLNDLFTSTLYGSPTPVNNAENAARVIDTFSIMDIVPESSFLKNGSRWFNNRGIPVLPISDELYQKAFTTRVKPVSTPLDKWWEFYGDKFREKDARFIDEYIGPNLANLPLYNRIREYIVHGTTRSDTGTWLYRARTPHFKTMKSPEIIVARMRNANPTLAKMIEAVSIPGLVAGNKPVNELLRYMQNKVDQENTYRAMRNLVIGGTSEMDKEEGLLNIGQDWSEAIASILPGLFRLVAGGAEKSWQIHTGREKTIRGALTGDEALVRSGYEDLHAGTAPIRGLPEFTVEFGKYLWAYTDPDVFGRRLREGGPVLVLWDLSLMKAAGTRVIRSPGRVKLAMFHTKGTPRKFRAEAVARAIVQQKKTVEQITRAMDSAGDVPTKFVGLVYQVDEAPRWRRRDEGRAGPPRPTGTLVLDDLDPRPYRPETFAHPLKRTAVEVEYLPRPGEVLPKGIVTAINLEKRLKKFQKWSVSGAIANRFYKSALESVAGGGKSSSIAKALLWDEARFGRPLMEVYTEISAGVKRTVHYEISALLNAHADFHAAKMAGGTIKDLVEAVREIGDINKTASVKGLIPVGVGKKKMHVKSSELETALMSAINENPRAFLDVMDDLIAGRPVFDFAKFRIRVPIHDTSASHKYLNLRDLGLVDDSGKAVTKTIPRAKGKGTTRVPVAKEFMDLWRSDREAAHKVLFIQQRDQASRVYGKGDLKLLADEELVTFKHPRTKEKFSITREELYKQHDAFTEDMAWSLIADWGGKGGIKPDMFRFKSGDKFADLEHMGLVVRRGDKYVPSQALAAAMFAKSNAVYARKVGWAVDTTHGQIEIFSDIVEVNRGPMVVMRSIEPGAEGAIAVTIPGSKGKKTRISATARGVGESTGFEFSLVEPLRLEEFLSGKGYMPNMIRRAVYQVRPGMNQFNHPIRLLEAYYGKGKVRVKSFNAGELVAGKDGAKVALDGAGRKWLTVEVNTGSGFVPLTVEAVGKLKNKKLKTGAFKGKDLLEEGGFLSRIKPEHVAFDLRDSSLGRLVYNAGESEATMKAMRRLHNEARKVDGEAVIESTGGMFHKAQSKGQRTISGELHPVSALASGDKVTDSVLREMIKNNPFNATRAAAMSLTPEARMLWRLYTKDGVVPKRTLTARGTPGFVQAAWERAGLWDTAKQAPTELGLLSAVYEFDYSSRWYRSLFTRAMIEDSYIFGSEVLDTFNLKAATKELDKHLAGKGLGIGAAAETLRPHLINLKRRMAAAIADHMNSGLYERGSMAKSIFEYTQEIWHGLYNKNMRLHDPMTLSVPATITRTAKKTGEGVQILASTAIEKGRMTIIADPFSVAAVTLKQFEDRLKNMRLVHTGLNEGLIRGAPGRGVTLDKKIWIPLDKRVAEEFGAVAIKDTHEAIRLDAMQSSPTLGIFANQKLYVHKEFANTLGLQGFTKRLQAEGEMLGVAAAKDLGLTLLGANKAAAAVSVQNWWRTNKLIRGGFGPTTRNLATNHMMILMSEHKAFLDPVYWSDLKEFFTHANRYDGDFGALGKTGRLPDAAAKHVWETLELEQLSQVMVGGKRVPRWTPEVNQVFEAVEKNTAKFIGELEKRGATAEQLAEAHAIKGVKIQQELSELAIKTLDSETINWAYTLAEKGAYKPAHLFLDSLHFVKPWSKAFWKYHLGVGTTASKNLDQATRAFRYMFMSTDAGPRYALGKYFYRKGFRGTELVNKVNGILPDFHRMSGSMRFARAMHPFIIYSLKQIAILTKAGFRHPGKILAIRMLAEQQRVEEMMNPSNWADFLDIHAWKTGYFKSVPGGQLSTHSLATTTDTTLWEFFASPWIIAEALEMISGVGNTLVFGGEEAGEDNRKSREIKGSWLATFFDRVSKAQGLFFHFGYGSNQLDILGSVTQLARDALLDTVGDPLEYVRGGANWLRLKEAAQGKRSTVEAMLRSVGIDYYKGTERDAHEVFEAKAAELVSHMSGDIDSLASEDRKMLLSDVYGDRIGSETWSRFMTSREGTLFSRAINKVFKLDSAAARRRFREFVRSNPDHWINHKLINPAMEALAKKYAPDKGAAEQPGVDLREPPTYPQERR